MIVAAQIQAARLVCGSGGVREDLTPLCKRQVHIPKKLDTHSGGIRAPVPTESERPFRANLIGAERRWSFVGDPDNPSLNPRESIGDAGSRMKSIGHTTTIAKYRTTRDLTGVVPVETIGRAIGK